jgi:hypothetical protein
MGRRAGGYYAKGSRLEFRRRRLQTLAHVGLGVLAITTVMVVVMALQW